AGTSTAFKEALLSRRRLQAGQQPRHQSRRQLQQLAVGTASNGSLVALVPAPKAQVFTPTCPREVTCNTVEVMAAYLDVAQEALAVPVRCVVLASAKDVPSTQAVAGLANDTT
ncbi:hypothetical protein Agub_g61, partial [Astrephomene gubernaculifera]